MADSIYDIPLKTITGEEITLRANEGKALLIVNTASQCGFTPQYEGLEKLHEEYAGRGLLVLGFPCNQFGAQEPGDEAEIQSFCQTRFDAKFQLFSKIEVNGDGTHPLYQVLKERAPGLLGTKKIKWNFTKFLVAPGEQSVKRFASTTKPEDLVDEIEKILPSGN